MRKSRYEHHAVTQCLNEKTLNRNRDMINSQRHLRSFVTFWMLLFGRLMLPKGIYIKNVLSEVRRNKFSQIDAFC